MCLSKEKKSTVTRKQTLHTDLVCNIHNLCPPSGQVDVVSRQTQTPLSGTGQHTCRTRWYSASSGERGHGAVRVSRKCQPGRNDFLFPNSPQTQHSFLPHVSSVNKTSLHPSTFKADQILHGSGNENMFPYEPLVYIAENVTADQWNTNIARGDSK